jgi:two-component system, LytTR family, sensor kinase
LEFEIWNLEYAKIMANSFIKRNIITILAHISAWGVFLTLPFLTRPQEGFVPPTIIQDLPLEGMFIFSAFLISVFYINYGLLVPRLLNRFGIRYYLPGVSGFLILHIILVFLIKSIINHSNSAIPSFALVFPFLLVIAMSLSVRLLVDRSQTDKDIKERENETLKSELSFLRSQISPHFLFNIMNNVIALSRIKPNMVEPTLIKLSQLMRYMLYSSDEKKVTIVNEVEYLENYIDLQKLRFGDSVEVNFNKNMVQTHHQVTQSMTAQNALTGSMTEGSIAHQIEPMLLIPFVENAFKHGTGMIQKPIIDMNLHIDNSKLIFSINNKYDPNSKEEKDKDSGIGLKNVSRRLELLYGNNQQLVVNTEGGVFNIQLSILFK